MANASLPIDYRALLDGMGQGVLLFDADGRLLLDNLAARAILGQHLPAVRAGGWEALAALMQAPYEGNPPDLDLLRDQARRTPNPIRFYTHLSGATVSCWIAVIYGPRGATLTLISFDQPAWEAITELTAIFRREASMVISATQGHAELVTQLLHKHADSPDTQALARRVMGFTGIIAAHTARLKRLIAQLERLEAIRTGDLKKQVREQRRKVYLANFIEDLLDEFAEESLVDPDMGSIDLRDRLALTVPDGLQVLASPVHLTYILRDVLRNAACYSPAETPIILTAASSRTGDSVQISVIDQGCGIRQSEQDRVFQPFQRSRQPQVIAVDGYGLSLYLARIELEAMGGSIDFQSEEGAGSTFTLSLPTPPPGKPRD